MLDDICATMHAQGEGADMKLLQVSIYMEHIFYEARKCQAMYTRKNITGYYRLLAQQPCNNTVNMIEQDW